MTSHPQQEPVSLVHMSREPRRTAKRLSSATAAAAAAAANANDDDVGDGVHERYSSEATASFRLNDGNVVNNVGDSVVAKKDGSTTSQHFHRALPPSISRQLSSPSFDKGSIESDDSGSLPTLIVNSKPPRRPLPPLPTAVATASAPETLQTSAPQVKPTTGGRIGYAHHVHQNNDKNERLRMARQFLHFKPASLAQVAQSASTEQQGTAQDSKDGMQGSSNNNLYQPNAFHSDFQASAARVHPLKCFTSEVEFADEDWVTVQSLV